MAGQAKKTADSAMAGRLKEDGVIRRTMRHPVTNQLIHAKHIHTASASRGVKGSVADFYDQIVFGGKK